MAERHIHVEGDLENALMTCRRLVRAFQRDVVSRRELAENVAATLVKTKQDAAVEALKSIPGEVQVHLLKEWDDYLRQQGFMPTAAFFLLSADESGDESRAIKRQLKDRYEFLYQRLQEMVINGQ